LGGRFDVNIPPFGGGGSEPIRFSGIEALCVYRRRHVNYHLSIVPIGLVRLSAPTQPPTKLTLNRYWADVLWSPALATREQRPLFFTNVYLFLNTDFLTSLI